MKYKSYEKRAATVYALQFLRDIAEVGAGLAQAQPILYQSKQTLRVQAAPSVVSGQASMAV